MKAVAIQKAINVIKMESWTSPVDFRYQDETSQFKMQADRIAAQKRGEIYIPKPWEGLPYLAKDDLGKIHVRGFLHDQIARNPDGTFGHPSKLTTPDLIKRLGRAWAAHAQKCRATQITHHRLVFSFSKEFHDAMVQAGRNPDVVLQGVVERTMRGFQDKFHPGDSVGYSYGLHHDTDNLHAHVYVHPRTRDGEFVGLSEQLQRFADRGAIARNKNQLKFVRESARRRAAQLLKEISDPTETNRLKNHFQSDRIFYVPRVSHLARTQRNLQPLTPTDTRLERKRAIVSSFDGQIATKRAAIREAVGGRHVVRVFRLRQPKWLRRLQAAQAAMLYRELRQLQAKRYQAMAEYWTARRAPNRITRATVETEPPVQTAPPAIKVRPPTPTRTAKPTVKSAKPHRRI
jgi:hypothetical protein